jgi:cathepsin L
LIQNVEVTQKEAPKNVIIDWTTEGAVGPVKNQGACASATVYATIGGVEGLSKIAYGTLKIFSSQELIDCVYGCHGGLMDSGYKYIQSHGKFYQNIGLCTAA